MGRRSTRRESAPGRVSSRPVGIMLVLCFALCGVLASGEEVRVFMVPHVTLVSWTLDSIKAELEQALNASVSLVLQSEELGSRPDHLNEADLIMAEKGSPVEATLAARLERKMEIPLVWGLAVREEFFALPASRMPSDLPSFRRTLESVKALATGTFPWFDSLFSGKTLFHLSHSLSLSGNDPAAGTQTLGGFLGAGLINPYALEADETLAFEVIEAGDAWFSSLWVPLRSLLSWAEPGQPWPVRLRKNLRLMPFPGPTGPAAFPTVVFQVFGHQRSHPAMRLEAPPVEVLGVPVEACSLAEETEWKKNRFREVYDSLVSGHP